MCVDEKLADSVREKRFSSQRGNVARGFTFRELAVATQNFKDANLIGEGGFGSVYKGRLESGEVSFVCLVFAVYKCYLINKRS